MFPFIITYSITLKPDYDRFSNQQIFESLRQDLKSDGVDRVIVDSESKLLFNNDFFSIRPGLNWNIWVNVSSGYFEIKSMDTKRVIYLVINVSEIFIIGFIAGLLFGLISKIWWFGAIAFGFLGILNWLITFIRHKFNFIHLVDGIKNNLK